jgi:hypothetical protein
MNDEVMSMRTKSRETGQFSEQTKNHDKNDVNSNQNKGKWAISQKIFHDENDVKSNIKMNYAKFFIVKSK